MVRAHLSMFILGLVFSSSVRVNLQTAVTQTVTHVCVQIFEQSGVSHPLQMELNIICSPEFGYPEDELNVEGSLLLLEEHPECFETLMVLLLSAVSTELGPRHISPCDLVVPAPTGDVHINPSSGRLHEALSFGAVKYI